MLRGDGNNFTPRVKAQLQALLPIKDEKNTLPAILIPFPCRLFPCHFRQAGWIPKSGSGINDRGTEAQHTQKCPMAFLVLIPLPSAESRLKHDGMKAMGSARVARAFFVVAPKISWHKKVRAARERPPPMTNRQFQSHLSHTGVIKDG